jgi:heme-degrading monooxygenase HmoA
MIVEYIRYRIADPGRRIDFVQAYAAAAEQLDLAPQCIGYELCHGVEEPDRFILRIEWTSVEDHEQGFRGGPQFPPFRAAIRSYVGDIEEMKHYTRTSVVSATGGAA